MSKFGFRLDGRWRLGEVYSWIYYNDRGERGLLVLLENSDMPQWVSIFTPRQRANFIKNSSAI